MQNIRTILIDYGPIWFLLFIINTASDVVIFSKLVSDKQCRTKKRRTFAHSRNIIYSHVQFGVML